MGSSPWFRRLLARQARNQNEDRDGWLLRHHDLGGVCKAWASGQNIQDFRQLALHCHIVQHAKLQRGRNA